MQSLLANYKKGPPKSVKAPDKSNAARSDSKKPHNAHLKEKEQQYKILETLCTEASSESFYIDNVHINAASGVLTLMFIIIDEMDHELLWRSWLASASAACRSRIRILIHAKYPHRVISPWIRTRLCRNFQLKPSWGSIELTEVMVRLLKESIDREDDIRDEQQMLLNGSTTAVDINTEKNVVETEKREEGTHKTENNGNNSKARGSHYAFLSESCIPIISLESFLSQLGLSITTTSNAKSTTDSQETRSLQQCEGLASSWLKYSQQATNGYASQYQFGKLVNVIPSGKAMKADQWILLERRHVMRVFAFIQKFQGKLNQARKKIDESNAGHEVTSGKQGENNDKDLFQGKEEEEEEEEEVVVPALEQIKEDGIKLSLAWFKQVRASDEMYFPTLLAMLGHIPTQAPTPTTSNMTLTNDNEDGKIDISLPVRCRAMTHCDWSQLGKSPESYYAADLMGKSRSILLSAIANQHVFLRKVKTGKDTNMMRSKVALAATSVSDGDKVSFAKYILDTIAGTDDKHDKGEKGDKGGDVVDMAEEEMRKERLHEDSERNKAKMEEQMQHAEQRKRDRERHSYSDHNRGGRSDHQGRYDDGYGDDRRYGYGSNNSYGKKTTGYRNNGNHNHKRGRY